MQYKEYEEVVVDHRAMKEKQRMKQEQEEREGRAATKVLVTIIVVNFTVTS